MPYSTPEQRLSTERYILGLRIRLRMELRDNWARHPLDRKARIYRMLGLRYSIQAARRHLKD